MKLKSRNFPHPVLNPHTDDFIRSEYAASIIHHKNNDNNLLFLINFKLNNITLLNFIRNKKASYNVHFECNSTMKRLSFSFYEHDLKVVSKDHMEIVLQGEVNISENFLNKKVDVNFFILAEETIEYYENEDVHRDFFGVPFKIQKGDILAFSIPQTIDIDKEPITSTNSVFKVSKATMKNAEPISIDFNDNQIEITLAESAYYKVANLKNFGNNSNKVLISMLYVPAVIDVLFNLQLLKDEYHLDIYESYDWYRTLEKKLQSFGYNIRELKPDEISSLSYKLLYETDDEPWDAFEKMVFLMDGEE